MTFTNTYTIGTYLTVSQYCFQADGYRFKCECHMGENMTTFDYEIFAFLAYSAV